MIANKEDAQQPKAAHLTDDQVWLTVLAAVASSANTVKFEVAQNWADRAVVEFNKRFTKGDAND